MFTNTMKLAAFTLKRERFTSPAWIIGIAVGNFLILLLIGLGMGMDVAARDELMQLFNNPALLAFSGPLHPVLGAAFSDIGYLYTLFMLLYVGICAAVMNILFVIRHTRADEEAGRFEVLLSLPSGRLASLNATMLSALVINVATGLLVAVLVWVGMDICGEPNNSFCTALLWGANITAIGMVFAAVAALFSQLSHSSSEAAAYSYLTLGLFYMLSAGANMSITGDREALAWASPIGIMFRTWPYVPDTFNGQNIANNVWWPVLIILAVAAVIGLIAYKLCSIRDIEQGFLPARKGKEAGGMLMKSSGGLSIRLLRRGIIAWLIIMFMLGVSYGTVFEDMDDFLASNEMYRTIALGVAPDIMAEIDAAGPDASTEEISAVMQQALSLRGFNLAQMFAGMIFTISAMFGAIPILMFILRARKEELAMRSELIIATPVSRLKYILGFVSITYIAAIFFQLLMGLGMYSMGQTMESVAEYLTFDFMMQSAFAFLPALWIFAAVTLLIVSLWPRRAGWAWGYFGFAFMAMMYARMNPSTEFLSKLTPIGWVPSFPIEEWSWASFIVLSLIALAITALSVILYSKRDLNVIKQ